MMVLSERGFKLPPVALLTLSMEYRFECPHNEKPPHPR